MIIGIDTASVAGNKNPNWLEAKAEGPISFAIIRSNWGAEPDGTFDRDWPRMKDAGLVRGAYLFLRFPHDGVAAAAPATQARAMIETVGPLDEGDLPPSLDVEFPKGRGRTGMSAEACLDGVREAWRVLAEHYGAPPIIYTSARVWREDLSNLPAPDLVESPLWLARYLNEKAPALRDPGVFAGGAHDPVVPPPWEDAGNWWIHQYQGDALALPGFATGNVDMNRFNVLLPGRPGGVRMKWVQRRLGLAQSGSFDAASEAAVRAFQDAQGLVSDGIIGPRTFAHLARRAVD
jgi:lysozyme